MVMKRTAMMMAIAMLLSAGITGAAQESVAAGPVSPVEGGKVIPRKPHTIADIKEGRRVQVKYHDVNGKMHATQVRAM
jgi:hypothetical protein